MLKLKNLKQIQEIRKHLANLHELWEEDKDKPSGKYCEGAITINIKFKDWFESNQNKKEYLADNNYSISIEIYSYLFGPSRLHTFNSIEEAHKEVLNWKYNF